MAPSVLGIGIPATSPLVPDAMHDKLQKVLNAMDSSMNASEFDWEILYVEPEKDMDMKSVTSKLREKKWDIVLIGRGLRTIDSVVPFFEKVVNAVHKEVPTAKFAFNAAIDSTLEDVTRASQL